jgi:hypothetical protein
VYQQVVVTQDLKKAISAQLETPIRG